MNEMQFQSICHFTITSTSTNFTMLHISFGIAIKSIQRVSCWPKILKCCKSFICFRARNVLSMHTFLEFSIRFWSTYHFATFCHPTTSSYFSSFSFSSIGWHCLDTIFYAHKLIGFILFWNIFPSYLKEKLMLSLLNDSE